MGQVYKQGISSPKGFNMTAAEPVDQRTIVEFLSDLYTLSKAYAGLKVQVLADINGETLREYKFLGGDYTDPADWEEVVGGGGTVDPATLPLKFTSFVFKKNIGQPATPSGGTYADPVPAGWSDLVPAGIDPLWMSSAIFTQASLDPIVWTEPVLTEDTDNVEYEYCLTADVPAPDMVNGKPLPPLEDINQRTYWHDDPTATDDWMAIGNKIGGEYPLSWDVIKIGGEQGPIGGDGPDGRAYKSSTAFTRSNLVGMEGAAVAGGGFSSPLPTETKISGNPVAVTWTDGIPVGDEKTWMVNFTFNDVDHATPSLTNIWSTPGGITDTATDDFEFSSSVSQPSDPDVDPGAWHNVATTNDIWMAHRSIKNGVISAWGITKIKGETGEQGEGLNIAGRDTIANILAKPIPGTLVLYEIWLASDTDAGATVPGVINDAYLYVGAGNGEAGTAWDNIGGITGTDGTSYIQSFVFQRSVAQPTTPTGGDFNNIVPAGWSDAPPVGTDTLWTTSRFFASDAGINAGLADWKAPYLAQDTVDLDFEYAGQQPLDATPLPPNLAAGGVWHNDPLETDYWMAKAKKVNGVTDDTSWEVIRIKGEQGVAGTDGVPSFLSSAYLKTNVDISGASVTGGTYVSPIPTSTADGKNWSDGIPVGTGAIWFTQVKFAQTDTGTKVWPAPSLVADSSIVEYQFSDSILEPVGDPVEGAPDGTNGWYDDASSVPGAVTWMAIGSIVNGVWPSTWDKVSVIGEKGETGLSARTYIPSTMFTRCDDTIIGQVTVTGRYMVDTGGGVFEIQGPDPTTDNTVGGFTYTFYDSVPALSGSFPNNALRVWAIQQVFNSVDDLGAGNPMQWGVPVLMADTGTVDYEYHPGIGPDHTEPGDPDSGEPGWVNQPNEFTYWIAQKNWADGVSAVWSVYRVRGEDGTSTDPGTPPNQVTGLSHTDTGYGKVTITWDVGSDIDGDLDHYQAQIINTGDVFDTVQSYKRFTGLSPTVSYDFKTRAVDEKGNNGPWSVNYTGTPLLDERNFLIVGNSNQSLDPCSGTVSTFQDAWCEVPLAGLGVGDYLYNDNLMQDPIDGGGEWWRTGNESISYRLGTDGYISGVASC